MVIRIPIDVKSLYFNIKNDNQKGHTATVSTPLRQGNSVRLAYSEINKIPENVDFYSREKIISMIMLKSRSEVVIKKVHVFNRISVNGELLYNIPSFCFYLREETDPKNVHCGRTKIHYPMSLKYEDLETDINNRKVINAISSHLHNYAFIVEAFEYDDKSKILNFDITVVGENNIPYSKVFINRRGAGNKFTDEFSENSDIYDMEIIALREKMGFTQVDPENFEAVIHENNKKAINETVKYLELQGIHQYRILKNDYPYALYDIEYMFEGEKNYLIVKQTSTKNKYFNLPINKIAFINDFKEKVKVVLVSDVNGKNIIDIYNHVQINDLDKRINSIIYLDRG